MAFGRTIDMSALSRNADRLLKLSKTAGARVVTRATATLKRKLATETRRLVSEEYGISTRSLGKRITTDSTANSVSIYGTTPRIPLVEFGGKFGRRGPGKYASAEIFRGERKTYEDAFIRKSGGNIVARAINKGTGKRYGRLPLRVLHGPSPESMVLGGGTPGESPATKVAQFAEDVFSQEVDRLVDVELRG